MRWVLFALIVVHGLLHLLGVTRGVAWLGGAALMLAAAATLITAPSVWWIVGVVAVTVSQILIASAWSDARFGTVANVIVIACVVYGFAAEGPVSLRAEFRRHTRERAPTVEGAPPVVTESHVAPLPDPVQRYLRATGAVGAPQVRNFTVSARGRIRAAAADPWMPFTAKQFNVVGENPARFFLMRATKRGLPVDVLHAFTDTAATMRVRLLAMLPIVRASGSAATRAEVVTILNDLCVLAPGALIDPAIRWVPIDSRSARAHYQIGAHSVSAVLSFNDSGELVDFVSDDRLVSSPDGRTFTRRRWSTPLRSYRDFHGRRVASIGSGVWHEPAGEFPYIELEVLDIRVNDGR